MQVRILPNPSMPIERERCEDCGKEHDVCPECYSTHVTKRDNPSKPSPKDIVDYGYGTTEVSYKHLCWNCGWSERVTLSIERD